MVRKYADRNGDRYLSAKSHHGVRAIENRINQRTPLALILSAGVAHAELRVRDGDTLLIDGQRVRLFVDAPERGLPGEAEAYRYLRYLRSLVAGRAIECKEV